MDPSTSAILRRTDALIPALHVHPVEKRRRVEKGVVRRLIRHAGAPLLG